MTVTMPALDPGAGHDSISAGHWRYWLLCAAVYVSLLYSVGLHPVMSIETPLEMGHFTGRGDALGADAWKLTRFAGDVERYMEQAEGTLTDAPWRYRVLPLAVAGTIGRFMPTAWAFIVMNAVATLTTAMLYTWFLRDHGLSKHIALLGGVLFLTMSPAVATMAYPMVDPASFLAALAVFVALERRHAVGFVVASIAAVLTKEVLALGGLLWLIRHRTWVAVVPLVAFFAVRLALGWESVPPDISRLADVQQLLWVNWGGTADILLRVFMAFSFLWLGLVNIRGTWLQPYVVLIPIVIGAAVAYSSHIERPMGILFPIVITSFLYFFERPTQPTSP